MINCKEKNNNNIHIIVCYRDKRSWITCS